MRYRTDNSGWVVRAAPMAFCLSRSKKNNIHVNCTPRANTHDCWARHTSMPHTPSSPRPGAAIPENNLWAWPGLCHTCISTPPCHHPSNVRTPCHKTMYSMSIAGQCSWGGWGRVGPQGIGTCTAPQLLHNLVPSRPSTNTPSSQQQSVHVAPTACSATRRCMPHPQASGRRCQ